MHISNSRRWAPRGGKRWIIAASALFTAALIRTLLHPLLGPVMPGTAFLIAAVLVEYYCGLAPAVCVMLAGLCIADFLFVPPYARIEDFDRADIKLLVSYPLITIVMMTLVERLKRAQYRAELLASVAQSRYEMLLRHDNERLITRRATEEMHRMLQHVTQYNRSLILIKALDSTTRVSPANFVAAANSPVIDDDAPRAGIAYGAKHADAHGEDIARVSDALLPGLHRIRFQSDEQDWRPVECVCERFATPSGDYLVLRSAA
ncbi:DUF4118 domain-containing protein [Caballeronia sp. GAWG1-1]|uniref:DUF4118 domain-containing protein n=1 Tax=Caballeronia sp. GAWG1-1 TaxID=2921742 RepID=UPI00202819B8|nr:DUF4118 domain-containing protein [Caballeronia sp. GAWG1-1]